VRPTKVFKKINGGDAEPTKAAIFSHLLRNGRRNSSFTGLGIDESLQKQAIN